MPPAHATGSSREAVAFVSPKVMRRMKVPGGAVETRPERHAPRTRFMPLCYGVSDDRIGMLQ